MKLERDGLIGINNWNAVGESLVGIISRVSTLNYFSWRDVKITFLTNPKVGKLPLCTSNASTTEGIDLSALSILFDDQVDVCKSFGNYYSPEFGPGVSIRRRLQLCPKCAEVGKHLFLHQLEHLHLCPIHNCRLHDKCIKCGSDLGVFEIPENQPSNRVFDSFSCRNCGHSNIDFRKQITASKRSQVEDRLRAFLYEYQVWLHDWKSNYQKVNWNNTASKAATWSVAMQLTEKSNSLKNYYKFPLKPLFDGTIRYRNELSAESIHQLRNRRCLPLEDPKITALAVNLFVYADAVLKIFRNHFEITDSQISTVSYLRRYNDIFWGEGYSTWANAYVELEDALYFTFRSRAMLMEGLYTRNWFIDCWYHYFAEWLLAATNLKVDSEIVLVSRLSRVWLRKFLTQMFADEVLRSCTNMLDYPQRIPHKSIVERLHPGFGNYDSLIMKHERRIGFGEITFWRTGPTIGQMIHLYKTGFKGYTPNMHTNYQNYKRLHKLFGIQDKHYKYDRYKVMLGMHSIVHIGD